MVKNNKLKKAAVNSVPAAKAAASNQNAETILKERLAKGEITVEEFDNLLSKIKAIMIKGL